MCFRPSDIEGEEDVLVCPNCGKELNAVAGALPSKCPFCKTVFDDGSDGAPKPPAPPRIPV